MATVAESMVFADHSDALEAAVGPLHVTGALLEAFFEAAKERADHYLNNPFLDDDGNDLPIPNLVVVGIYRLTAHLIDQMPEDRRGIASIGNHAINISYIGPTEAEDQINRTYFWPSKSLTVF